MRDVVLPEHCQVGRGEVLLIPELDGVGGLGGELGEEGVESLGEIGGADALLPGDGLDLEDEGTQMVTEVLQGGADDLIEAELSIQEIGVLRPRDPAILVPGKGVDRDPVPHFLDALEPGGERIAVPAQRGGRERPIEAGVDPDGAEEGELRVLRQHLGDGAGLRVLPVVDQPLPPFVIPGRGAEMHQRRDPLPEGSEFVEVAGAVGEEFHLSGLGSRSGRSGCPAR